MKDHAAERSAALPCHRCGYDLRAHPPDGKCPECGESVAESRRLAAILPRPAWRDSDPRWRRRMLAGVWVLVFLPLMDALQVSGWASSIPVPNVFGLRGARMLDDTLLSYLDVYQILVFCIGVVLLFSKERGRRPGRLDWTRRWGVFCSYVVFLLAAADFLVLAALVLAGIATLFLGMPLKYQPEVTGFFVNVSTAYLRYAPDPNQFTALVLVTFSSIAILLACAPLFDALRSSGPKRLAAILLVPLAFFSLMHIALAALRYLDLSFEPLAKEYFRPHLLTGNVYSFPGSPSTSGTIFSPFVVEATKWCIVLAIAIWLSIAQVAAWRHGRKASAA